MPATAARMTHDTPEPHDAEIFAQNMREAAELWQHALKIIFEHQESGFSLGHTDPLALAQTFLSVARHANIDPNAVLQHNLAHAADTFALWHRISEKLLGRSYAPYVQESPKDRRFKDKAWQDSTVHDFIKQSYLINAQWMERMVGSVQGIDDRTAHKLRFFSRQWIDALSPSNFLLTNPEVMRVTLESNGENLVRGLTQLVKDLERGEGKLRISMTDESAFRLGENIAATPGSVVYQNELIQLIQYTPQTEQHYSVPLLITPAWINKYYVLDLTKESSLVQWLVSQGYNVFMISWVNPDEHLGRKSFDDYLRLGPLAALEAIERITNSPQTSVMGYCLGGTLTAIMIAYLRARGEEKRIASATYLTTMLDYTEAGDLAVFIDELSLESLEERMSERGYLDGYDMATTFSMLRANDLIWSFVVNNYLLGKAPFPFDLLYWNADSTRMPAVMHSFYLRKMYQQNLLAVPNGIELLGTPINLTRITTPSYLLSTREDHIAPWTSTYAATQMFDGPTTFVLADSGHIAGVISPPTKKKYNYCTNKNLPPKAEEWARNATEESGSWWPHWHKWQQSFAGKMVRAKKPGSKHYPVLEPAPGSYVRVKVV